VGGMGVYKLGRRWEGEEGEVGRLEG